MLFLFLISLSVIGFAACGNDTTADAVDEETGGDDGSTPDDQSPSVDEEDPSGDESGDIAEDTGDIDDDIDEGEEGDEEEEEDDVEEAVVSPTIVSFAASEDCVEPGSRVTLNWETANADAVYLNSTQVEASGSKKVWAISETTQTLTAVRGDQTKSQSVSIYLKEGSLVYETTEESFEPGTIDQLQAADDGTLLVLSEGRVYKGGFGGDFSLLTPNSSVSAWSAVAIDAVHSDVMYAGTTGRIYRSSNGGSSFPDVIPIRRNNIDLDLNAIYVSPAKTNLVYIGFEGGGFVLDTDRTSLELKSDLNTESVRRFAADEACVVAATRSGIFLSLNEGDSWSEKNAASWGDIHALNIFDGVLYVSAENGLYSAETSTLSNPSWTQSEGLEGPVYQVLVRREHEMILGGLGFVGPVLTTLFPQSVVYAATENGLYRQVRDTWEQVTDDEVYWILEGGDPLAVSGDSLMSIERNTVYSEDCPNQPPVSMPLPADFSFPPI